MTLTSLILKTSVLFCAVMVLLVTSGCALFRHNPPSAAGSAPIVTPDLSLAAKVVAVNTVGRFVVLSFPDGQMPRISQPMFVYRGGLKVAEVRITGPQQANNIVADIVSGDAEVGDTVSDE